MNMIFIGVCLYLSITVFLCLYRGVKGPTLADRIVAINVISTKTVVVIAVLSYVMNERFFLDVALVYALISFVATVYISTLNNIFRKSEVDDY